MLWLSYSKNLNAITKHREPWKIIDECKVHFQEVEKSKEEHGMGRPKRYWPIKLYESEYFVL